MILGIVLGKEHYIWAGIAGIYITVQDIIIINNKLIQKIIKTISKYSFAIYLCHMFSFDMAFRIKEMYQLGTVEWLIISLSLITVISIFLVNICGKLSIPINKENVSK